MRAEFPLAISSLFVVFLFHFCSPSSSSPPHSDPRLIFLHILFQLRKTTLFFIHVLESFECSNMHVLNPTLKPIDAFYALSSCTQMFKTDGEKVKVKNNFPSIRFFLSWGGRVFSHVWILHQHQSMDVHTCTFKKFFLKVEKLSKGKFWKCVRVSAGIFLYLFCFLFMAYVLHDACVFLKFDIGKLYVMFTVPESP